MDIDKLFLSSIQYKVNREEGEDGKYHQTITDAFDSKEDTYFQNNLIRYYITLLLDWKSLGDHTPRTTNSLNRPIDRDTDLLKNIIKDLEENKPTAKEEPYMFYSLSTQTESKNDYITGKIGIGPFALNNNNHVLTMMYHVRFKHIESSIMSALDLEQLDRRVDKNGESILSWLSGLINAHVDIAKDPYISRLNVNPFTYNIVNLLVRTGLGDKTFYFTTQPIMKALAEAYVNDGSMYMNDQYRSKYTLQQEAIDNVAEQWFKDSGILFEGKTAKQLIDVVVVGGEQNADIRTKINDRIKKLFDKNLKSDAKGELNLENQLFYYLAYLQFDKYAKALSSLVTYSKIDTKKHGKSVTEHLVYEQGYNKTYDVTRDSSLFDPVGLSHMRNDSYIAVKTNNAINSIRDILGSQFIQSTPAFLGSVNAILKAIGREDSLSANLVSKVADALSAAIKSKFFTEQYVPTITDNPNFMHDLVSESQEVMDFAVRSQGNVIELSGKKYHDLQSYINKPIQLGYKMTDGSTLYFVTTVIGVNESANTVTVQHVFPPMYGTAVLRGGENTIYDRFSRLSVAINSDPAYSNLKDESGNISNRLLLMLVPGKETRYTPAYIQGEQPDTYETMKFVKFFNFVEDSGNTANYIIDAWEELLGYTNDNKEVQKIVRDFARDLIVYGFITSGDKGGFKKIFKYVPASWRESSGYGNYIYDKLVEYSVGDKTDIDIQDVILNNWFDNEFVRTYTLKDKETDKPQFMEYHTKINGQLSNYPTILAALKNENGFMVPSIDPENAPLFIKIKRRFDYASYDSQRRFTVYKFHKMAISNTGVEYPVYIKVNPKGNQTSDGFLITEYGRSDAINMPEYEINEQVLEATYKATNVTQYVQSISKTNKEFAAIISGLNRKYQEDVKLDEVVSSVAENQQIPQTTSTNNTVSQVPSESPQLSILSESQKPIELQKNITGENITSKGSEFAKKLTNPGNNLKVVYKGREFRNSEHAYQTWKSGEFDEVAYNSNEFKPKGSKKVNKAINYGIMVEIITAKLQQHPELVQGIRQRGGIEYLKHSTHNMIGDRYWESSGQNKFIEALIDAYNNVSNNQQPNNNAQQFDISKAELYSGAAEGADKFWGAEARALGIKVVDYTRDSWNSLSQEWKNKLSSEYEETARQLARPIIPLGGRGDIEVRRDMMQADKADAIFAIGNVVKSGQKGAKYTNKSDHDVVDGGTGYAVQRGIIRGIPVYVFDLTDKQWKMWDNDTKSFISTSLPTLTKNAAVIGTRGINESGMLAIKNVLAKTIDNISDFNTTDDVYKQNNNAQQNDVC